MNNELSECDVRTLARYVEEVNEFSAKRQEEESETYVDIQVFYENFDWRVTITATETGRLIKRTYVAGSKERAILLANVLAEALQMSEKKISYY